MQCILIYHHYYYFVVVLYLKKSDDSSPSFRPVKRQERKTLEITNLLSTKKKVTKNYDLTKHKKQGHLIFSTA